MAGFDLKECLNCKEEAFLARFGRVPSFAEVERSLASLKGTDRALTISDLRRMTSKQLWNFDDFWTIPPKKLLRKRLRETGGLFSELPHREEHTIGALYAILKNIEVVSVVLRFVNPSNYGIISPPVRYAIRLGPGKSYVDEYLDFLHILRRYKEDYDFSRVADVDIALWILSHKCILSGHSGCKNFLSYQEMIVYLDEEIVKKSRAFREMQDELLSIVAEEEKNRSEELERRHSEINEEILASEQQKDNEFRKKAEELRIRELILEKELDELRRKRIIYPENLIQLAESDIKPKAKLIHDHKEKPVDFGQTHFMEKLTAINVVNKVIWSENTTSRLRTRISQVKSNGEVTILYVNKNGYAAKIISYPVACPDLTHAKYFATIISKIMDIPITESKTGQGSDINARNQR